MFNPLKKIPIRFTGRLNDIHLVNFSVDLDEVKPYVPSQIPILERDGRALISMVNVRLSHMKPASFPDPIHFAYQHIGFRLLVEDAPLHEDGINRGIFFIRSFCKSPLIALGGSMLTEYRLESASIFSSPDSFTLRSGNEIISYSIDRLNPEPHPDEDLRKQIGAIDRAYSMSGNQIQLTKIVREKWPLKQLRCIDFKTSFFNSARLEGIFQVPETIYYQWLPPKPVDDWERLDYSKKNTSPNKKFTLIVE